ncbi:hypothetical protein NDU88_005702 [Pleurodeles waltl]|uniref:Uncharacterized protein n=1 Tax=Pleurodeles waltl TaxID=8319 RepID=A0AAV7QIL2_PLEWA|nr:hypothetical protein NDU88_005702 [Pleurodeles waltl]
MPASSPLSGTPVSRGTLSRVLPQLTPGRGAELWEQPTVGTVLGSGPRDAGARAGEDRGLPASPSDAYALIYDIPVSLLSLGSEHPLSLDM